MMIAEHTACFRFPGLTLRFNVCLEIPGEAGVSVVIGLPYEAEFTEDMRETVDRYLRNGVHGGLALLDLPLPADGIKIVISECNVTRSSDPVRSKQAVHHLGAMLEMLMRQTVATLWEGLYTLRDASEEAVRRV